jgi:Mce-associated membrane protein
VSAADTEQENTVSDEPTAPAGAKARPVVPIVLGALGVIMLVVNGVLGFFLWSAHTKNRDNEAALDAARTRAPIVLSYAPATVDKDVEAARAQLSGTFAAQFDQLVNQVVLPATKQQGLGSKAETTHAALIDPQADHSKQADVLVLMHQVVTSTTQPKQEGVIQVKVTVTKNPDGQWLVSNLQPI